MESIREKLENHLSHKNQSVQKSQQSSLQQKVADQMKCSLIGADKELLRVLEYDPKQIKEDEDSEKEVLTEGGGADSARTEKFDYKTHS